MDIEYDIERNRNEIKVKFKKVAPIEDLELQGDFQKYLCILICGHYEQSIKALFLEYIAKQSNGKLTQLFEKRVLKYQSQFKFDELYELLKILDNSLKETFSKNIEKEKKNNIGSLIDNRNKLAHGSNTSLSIKTLNSFFDTTTEIIQELKNILALENN